jgi:hypothetical protein
MEPGYFSSALIDIHRDIRLIFIEPAQDPDAIIECTLVRMTLFDKAAPAYIAVSYVWGDSSVTEEICRLPNSGSIEVLRRGYLAIYIGCGTPV